MLNFIKNRWIWITLVAVLVVGGFAFVNNNSNAAASEVGDTDTAVAFLGDLSTSTSTSGQVEAEQSANLSVKTAGLVDEIFVREGDQVAEGDPLLQVDTTDLEIRVERAEQTVALQATSLEALLNGSRTEDIAAAEASVASAQATLNNLLAGPDEFDIAESEANIRSQQASVASASASYNTTLDTITDSQIAQAELSLLNARNVYEDAVEANEDNPNGTTHDAMMDAYDAYQIAQKTLDDLLDGPTQGSIASSAGSLSAASANLAGAEAQFENLLAGASAQQIASAEASLARAEASLANLLEPATEESIAIAEENLRQAELSLLDAQESLENATLLAPFDGIITGVHISEGEYASGLVVEIVSDQLKVVLEVDEIDIGQVTVGQAAKLDLETWPNDIIDGTVTAIAPSANGSNSIVAYDVTIAIQETSLPILVGMTANADLITADFSDVLLVPNSAITADRTADIYTVSVVSEGADGSMTLETLEVEIGSKNGDFTEIVSGLNAGDEVALGVIEAPVEAIGVGPGQR